MYTFGGIPILLVVWCGLAHTLDNLSLDEAWESWKITHRREYNGLVSSILKGLTNKVKFCFLGMIKELKSPCNNFIH